MDEAAFLSTVERLRAGVEHRMAELLPSEGQGPANLTGAARSALVSPGKRQLFFALGAGEYRFRVRARNADGYGPWSRPTDLVRPR